MEIEVVQVYVSLDGTFLEEKVARTTVDTVMIRYWP
jgi:hypothetical protein